MNYLLTLVWPFWTFHLAQVKWSCFFPNLANSQHFKSSVNIDVHVLNDCRTCNNYYWTNHCNCGSGGGSVKMSKYTLWHNKHIMHLRQLQGLGPIFSSIQSAGKYIIMYMYDDILQLMNTCECTYISQSYIWSCPIRWISQCKQF